MEQMEMKTIYQLKEQEQKINENSVISNVDIISELEKIKRAQQTTKAGTKKSYISKLENGENPTIETLLKVLQYFNKMQTFNQYVVREIEKIDNNKSLY